MSEPARPDSVASPFGDAATCAPPSDVKITTQTALQAVRDFHVQRIKAAIDSAAVLPPETYREILETISNDIVSRPEFLDDLALDEDSLDEEDADAL